MELKRTPDAKWLLIVGDPVDGFMYFGPFDTYAAAVDDAHALNNADYWIVAMNAPSTTETQDVE